MSVQFQTNPQKVIIIHDEEHEQLQNPGNTVPLLNGMNSRSDDYKNPYAYVQKLLAEEQHNFRSREMGTEAQNDNYSREMGDECFKLRQIFDKYDTNRDGYLERRELLNLISQNPVQCSDLPEGLIKAIMKRHDNDGDGKLDFEEFIKLSQEHNWLVRDLCVRYCRTIIPRRNGGSDTYKTVYSTPRQSVTTDGAYEKEMKFYPPPLTMIIFSIIEVAFFVTDVYYTWDFNEQKRIEDVGTSTSGPIAKLFKYTPDTREETWRFVTYMFVHAGVKHLMSNVILQIFLGIPLELVNSWWRVALVYLSGVIAGSLGTSIVSPRTRLCGASGGVYALITAHIATIILNWHEMEYASMQLFVFLVFCTTDLESSIYRHIYIKGEEIGYTAHLCGAIAGLLVGIGVLRNLNVRSYQKKLWWAAVLIFTALMIAGFSVHIFYPDYFISIQVRAIFQ